MLETQLGWSGYLAEANPRFIEALKSNRSSNHISEKAIFSETGKNVAFADANLLSTLEPYIESDHHKRNIQAMLTVQTLSLNDFLKTFNSPSHIDFISIDTEGSELEILRNFDFGQISFGAICVEHNHSQTEGELRDLLNINGYTCVLSKHSGQDIWAVRQDHLFSNIP